MIDCECEAVNLIVIARANAQSNPRITLHPVIARFGNAESKQSTNANRESNVNCLL
ncbi:hypothetical protein [Helicobacter sp. 23-1045]